MCRGMACQLSRKIGPNRVHRHERPVDRISRQNQVGALPGRPVTSGAAGDVRASDARAALAPTVDPRDAGVRRLAALHTDLDAISSTGSRRKRPHRRGDRCRRGGCARLIVLGGERSVPERGLGLPRFQSQPNHEASQPPRRSATPYTARSRFHWEPSGRAPGGKLLLGDREGHAAAPSIMAATSAGSCSARPSAPSMR